MSSPPPPPSPGRPRAYWHSTLIISLGFFIAVTSFAAGVLAERDLFRGGGFLEVGQAISSLGSDTTAEGSDLSRLREIQRLIEEEYYYRPSDPRELAEFRRQLEYDAIQGMTEGLSDDYTTFLVPVEQGPVEEQMSGEYEGIGVWVEYPDGEFTIVAPMPGSPAEQAGLRAGDVIVEADGHPLKNVDEKDAITFVRGPAGSVVRLTVRRPGVEDLLTVEVTRRKITMPAVAYQELTKEKIGVIQVTVFGDKTTEELDQAIARAKADGVEGVVLDLRNNGGGWVESAQQMIGRFVPADRGAALWQDVDPNDDELESEPILGGGQELFDLPMVVLVNGGTASAAEIVVGALNDYERATIVGEQTFGKGSVQKVHDFADGSSARITFAQWLTPNKQVIHDVGIAPDVVVTVPEGEVGDPLMDRAVAILENRP